MQAIKFLLYVLLTSGWREKREAPFNTCPFSFEWQLTEIHLAAFCLLMSLTDNVQKSAVIGPVIQN